MKIFLCSTAYDLSEFRAVTVGLLEKNGHDVLFHESPTFPARVGLHSHDQCIEAVKDSDLVICLIDRRYGGKYAGNRLDIKDQEFEVLGATKSGKKKKFKIKVEAKNLSITWLELITAHDNAIPIITFARQRTLDEKETRRRNQFLSSFMPAHTEKNELFDQIDWITKQKANNWIAPFISIVDFQQKLTIWMKEIEKTIIVPKQTDQKDVFEKYRICILVEGELDRLFVSFLVSQLRLQHQYVIIPVYGKYNMLSNFQSVVAQYTKIYKQVIILLDSDATTDSELEENRRQLSNIIANTEAENISYFFAHPSINAWISSGIETETQESEQGALEISAVLSSFSTLATDDMMKLLENRFSFDRALSKYHDFDEFVGYLYSFDEAALKKLQDGLDKLEACVMIGVSESMDSEGWAYLDNIRSLGNSMMGMNYSILDFMGAAEHLAGKLLSKDDIITESGYKLRYRLTPDGVKWLSKNKPKM